MSRPAVIPRAAELPRVSRWTRFWHEPVRGERLALVKILTAAALLTDHVFQFLPGFADFFGPEGYAPRGVLDETTLRRWWWPIFFLNTDNLAVLYPLFFIWMAATCALLVGWHTRIAAAASWLLAMGFSFRNVHLMNGGDDVLLIALFMLMISSCGRAWSLDARRRGKAGSRTRLGAIALDDSRIDPSHTSGWIDPWPVRLLQIQLCVLYLAAGVAKLGGRMWWEGTTIHYVINSVTLARWSYAEFPLPLWITAAVSYASVWFEVLFTPLAIWPRTRKWALLAGVLFHLGIWIVIEVGWFSFYTLALYGAWYTPRGVRPLALAGRMNTEASRRPPGARAGRRST